MPFLGFKQIGLAVVAISLSSSVGAALVPRQSGAPTCTYSCPPYDGFGNIFSQPWYPPSTLFYGCTYYLEVNGMGQSTNCVYAKSDGKYTPGLTYNGPEFSCPAQMDQVCTPERRDTAGVYKAYLEKRERRAAMPAPSVPDYMSTRASLLKKRSVNLEDTD